MNEDELLAYVQASANLLQVPLSEARAQAVALHLGRTAAMARLLDTAPRAMEGEIAQIYCPAPFPQEPQA
jgi:hypothetical protein